MSDHKGPGAIQNVVEDWSPVLVYDDDVEIHETLRGEIF